MINFLHYLLLSIFVLFAALALGQKTQESISLRMDSNDQKEWLPKDLQQPHSNNKKEWCSQKWKNFSESLVPGLSWGKLLVSDRKLWQTNNCILLIFDSIADKYLGGITSRKDTIERANELGLSKFIVSTPNKMFSNTGEESELFFFGANAIDAQYEQKYPWLKFICPGSIVLDIGTHNGDSTVIMAAASRGGVVLGFELNRNSYLAVEWAVRLNNRLHIVPYNFGVGSSGKPRWEKDAHGSKWNRIVPFFDWLENKLSAIQLQQVSLVKIDIDGLDKDIVASFASLSKRMQPLFLIEWYQDFRTGSLGGLRNDYLCNVQSRDIWAAAGKIGYKVYSWKLDGPFEKCEDALQFLYSDSVPAWKYHNDSLLSRSGGGGRKEMREKDHAKCGHTAKELDLCDIILMPAATAPSDRKSLCRPPLTVDEIEGLKAM